MFLIPFTNVSQEKYRGIAISFASWHTVTIALILARLLYSEVFLTVFVFLHQREKLRKVKTTDCVENLD